MPTEHDLIDTHGPKLPFIDQQPCCGAARQTGHSLQPRNQVASEFTQCGTKTDLGIFPTNGCFR